MESSPSLRFIAFGLGFTLAAAATMVTLTLARPLFGPIGEGAMVVLMLSPVVTGGVFGLRVARGVGQGLGLWRAVKRGLFLKAD